MRLTVWGCRGSVPTPGPDTVRYGGNTSCVELSLADGTVVIFDAGVTAVDPAVVVDRNVAASERPVIDAFMQYLWSDEAQRAFVKYHFRSSTTEAFDKENKELATIKMPFTVNDPLFGGWEKAYPEVIEGVFRDLVQKRK